MKNMKIDANGTEIRVIGDVLNEDAYVSLTDIAKFKNPANAFIVIANWMRNYSTISFLGLWEKIHNPDFKPIEFDRFKTEAGSNSFVLTPQQWIESTNAVGWDVRRELSKINYRIHTDAVKECLITPTLSPQEMAYTYASEADILNMALFGKTASQWRSEQGITGKMSTMRDFASAEELVVLINLEDTNADLLRQKVPKIERLKILREKAYRQLAILRNNQDTVRALKQNFIENNML